MERNCNKCKNPDCFWVGVDDDEICDEYLPKTNADRIRVMTDEELEAEFWRIYKELPKYSSSTAWFHEWLKQEAT